MPSKKKNSKQGSRLQSVEETNAALAKEFEDDARKDSRTPFNFSKI
jgi:hypothetical protein